MWPPAIKSKVQRTTIARPLHDVARSSHNLVERRAMSLVYTVRWRFTTSCDLVRPIKIILRYLTMLGISVKLLNITNTSGDDPWWLRRRATSHDYTRFTPDGPRSPKFTHRKSSYGVVKAGVTVALICMSTLHILTCSSSSCIMNGELMRNCRIGSRMCIV